MRTSVRRFLVFQAFLLWQGGFLFYAAVVVPIGTDVLGSARAQGDITQQVSNWLNVCGAVWCAVFLWELLATRDPARWRRIARWVGWAATAILLGVLAVMHRVLDRHLDADVPYDRDVFYPIHETYLTISGVHWFLGLALAWLTMEAWRADDRAYNGRT